MADPSQNFEFPVAGPMEECRFILEHLAQGVFTVNERRQITFFNTAAEDITGYRREDVLGRPCYAIFKTRSCRDFCKLDEAVEVGRKALNFDIEIENQAGFNVPINISVAPILDKDGRLVGGVESFEDRSLVHELLQNIKNSNERFRMILDSMTSAVVTVDKSGRITSFNRQAEELTGYPRSKAIGHLCHEIFKGRQCETSCGLKKLMAREVEGSIQWEMDITNRSGVPIPVRVSCVPMKNDNGRIIGALETLDNLSLVHELQKEIQGKYQLGDMVGQGPLMQRIFGLLPIIAASPTTVLITGPTGSGKDVLASVIHGLSDRSDRRMVKVNCASLPENLLESEMFGYKKGAFTGAISDKPGLFQLADRSDIFLDEIGDLPLSLQAKLLRVLEDREFYPLGARATVKVDVRIIAATNRELEQLVAENKFRADLYYRLNVMKLEMPSLRERMEDLPLLIDFIMAKLNLRRKTPLNAISPQAMRLLLNHPYPGNIRELKNILEHAFILCQESVIEPAHLPLYLTRGSGGRDETAGPNPAPDIGPAIAETEKQLILAALERNDWNKTRTARELNMDRTTLWRKLRRLDIRT